MASEEVDQVAVWALLGRDVFNSVEGGGDRGPTAARNADGRLEVFARGPSPGGGDRLSNYVSLYHRWQTAPNNDWSGR
jgi:hypothetical protein